MASLRQLIESALTSVQVQGAIPKEIRAALVEQNRLLNPMYGLIPRFAVQTNKYYWQSRTALPQGGASLEAPPTTGVGSVPESASVYNNNNVVNIRNLSYRGNVSKIAEQVATRAGRVIENEMKGQAESETRDETILNLYGYESATVYSNKTQWTGFEGQVLLANKTKVSGPVALAVLDGMFDTVRTAVGMASLGKMWAYFMSPRAQTSVNALYTNVNRQNLPVETFTPAIDPDVFGEKDADFYAAAIRGMAGIEIMSYRGCPIVPAQFIPPTGTMGSVTIGTGSITGTTFPGSQAYYYRMEGVTQLGKTIACAEVNNTPSSGNSVKLTWTTPVVNDRNGNPYAVLLYRVFRSTTTGTETLYAIVGGYDINDNPVTAWTDDNAAHNPLASVNATSGVPSDTSGWFSVGATAGTSDLVTVPVTASNVEDIFLMPIDPEVAGMAVLNEMQQEQLAPTTSRSVQFETTADMAFTMLTPAFGAMATGVTH